MKDEIVDVPKSSNAIAVPLVPAKEAIKVKGRTHSRMMIKLVKLYDISYRSGGIEDYCIRADAKDVEGKG